MTMNLAIDGLSAYILVFCRMGGMVFFNPLLARKNIPSQFNVALVLGITVLITPMLGWTPPANFTDFMFLWMMMKELFVGVACGFVFQIFYYLLLTAGDVVDMGFGLSMAKAFDPASNVQMSVSGNLFQMLFVVYFFATDSHLTFIKLMVSTYDLVGVGAVSFGADVGRFLFNLFSSTFMLVMQLAMPFIAASFILEISMGILMKLIPQINVFSIHFQFKIILGFILLFLFIGPTAQFIETYIRTMLISMQSLLGVI